MGLVAIGLCAGTLYWRLQRPTAIGPAGTNRVPSLDDLPGSRRDLSLSPDETEFLWELEHRGNLLGKFGLKPMGRLLADRDGEALLTILADDFDGRIFEEPRETAASDEGLAAFRRERSSERSRPLGRVEFADWLLDLRAAHTAVPITEFGVSALSPVDRDDLDGDWQITCKMRMAGGEPPAEQAETAVIMKLRTAGLTRERLSEPGWLKAASIEQVAVARAPRTLFVESVELRGIDATRFYDNWNEERKLGQTGSLYACDYNRDGCVDLLVTDYQSPGIAFYRGSPDGNFEEVAQKVGLLDGSGQPAAGLTGIADDCTFADLDNDGWEDLIVFAGGLFRNIEGQRFEDVSHHSNLFSLIYGPGAPQNGPSAILPADYDRDGLVDLYVVRTGKLRDSKVGWIEEEPLLSTGNQLLHNLGKGRFEDVTRKSGTAGGGRSVFTAAWLDANNDGWPDVYVINEFGKGLLLVNNAEGTFREHFLAQGPADFGSMGLAVGDIDNDGWIDIYSANMYSKAGNRVIANLPLGAYDDDTLAKFRRLVGGSRLYRNRGGLTFEEVGRSMQVHDVGWAWGASLADFNNDGWLDLYATAGYMSRDRTKPDG